MPEPIDRRSFLARATAAGAGLAVVGTTGGLLAGCGSGPHPPTAGSAPRSDGIARATPRPGGSLVFGTEAEEYGFSPTQASFDATGILYARTVFDPLAIMAADNTVQPYLAQAIAANADHTVWTITMRPDVAFHNGAPCDAAAVAANINAQRGSALTGSALTTVSAVQVTGPLEVTVTMRSPWVPFDHYLAGAIGGQVSFIAEPRWLASGAQTDPVGTGPFVFESWTPNDHFTAVKNHHYWRPGLPHLDSITYKPIVDPEQILASLRSGSVDIIHTTAPAVIASLRADRSMAYIDDAAKVAGEPDMNCVLLNLSKAPFDNLKVRRAAAMAVSSVEYARADTAGVLPASDGPFVPGSPYHAPTGYPAANPGEAARLIEEVRQETGRPVSLVLNHVPDPTSIRDAEFVQQQMQTAGMDVTLGAVQQADIIDTALLGRFQAQMWRQFGAVDPDLNYIFWSPTTINPVYSINMARNADPAMQTALLKGRESTNQADRTAAYQEVGRLMGSDIPYLWTSRNVWAVAAHPRVANFNNPTTPAGSAAFGLISGAVWPTHIWLEA
jgi:peptide/nickel transport system substrate-binding protein